MRIAILSDTIFPTPYSCGHGLGRAIYNVASGLCDKGHAVTLYALDGSRLPGGTLVTTGRGGTVGESVLAHVIAEHRDSYDVAIDAGHRHALAARYALPTLAYFQDRASSPARCAVFVSKDQRAHVGLDGPVVRNGVRIDDFPLYDGDRADYLLYLGSAKWQHKGLKDAREVARIAGLPLQEYGRGCKDGKIDSESKVPVIQHARAMLCPYHVDAGPLTPLEAMACGTPVIGYSRASMPEYVPEGGGMLGDTIKEMAGLLGIARTYSHEFAPADVRKVMVDAGFTAARQVDEIEALLPGLINGDRW